MCDMINKNQQATKDWIGQQAILISDKEQSRISSLKTPNKVFVQLNSGFNHFIRPIFYDSYHEIINITNPNDKEYYEYMLSYSPYDNISNKNYPNLLVTTGLYDSQVQYWEPAKWVARLRKLSNNTSKLYLHTNMDAGHGGSSGRFESLKEIASVYAFIFDLESIKK